MSLLRISLQEFFRRRLRTWLTIVSIAIGVAAIVSVMISTRSARLAQQGIFEAMSSDIALEVKNEGGGVFDEKLLETLRDVPGVQDLLPSIRRFAMLTTNQGKQARVQLAGMQPNEATLLRSFRLAEGRLLEAPNEILMDKNFAKTLGLRVDDSVKLLTYSGKQEALLVGLLEPSKVSAVTQGAVAITSLRTAQRWFRSRERIDTIQVRLQPKALVTDTQKQIQERLATGFRVQPPDGTSESAEEMLRAMQNGLRVSTTFGMIIAIFIIYNTFQMSIGERRRQIGILRAIGTTQWQITRMIVVEAMVLGCIGIALGWVIGVFGAQGLSYTMGKMLGVPLPRAHFDWYPFLISGLAGGGVTLIGALLPAYFACKISPSDAMKVVSSQDFERVSHWPTWIGVLMISVGVVALILGAIYREPVLAANWGAGSFLIGWIFLLPASLGPASRAALRLVHGWIGIHGRLAQQQLMRHRYRSAITVGVLFLAISTSLGLSLTLLDNIFNVQTWYERSIVGDFFVRAALPDMATGSSADMPEDMRETLTQIPGIEAVDSIRFVSVRSDEATVIVLVRDFISDDQIYFDLVTGDEAKVVQQVRDGGVVIGSVLAERAKYRIGDNLPLKTLRGDRELKIVGIANDYLVGGLTVYMHRPQGEELFDVTGADVFIIKADERRLSEVEEKVLALCLERGLMFQSYKDLIRYIHSVINAAVASLWILLAIGTVIACFGLINTLAMNILEQTREIGLLRAVAMTRGQVRQLIASQAVLIAIIAIVPGVPMGIFIAYLLNLASASATGHALEFHLRPGLIGAAIVLELLLAGIAALIPAERAARLAINQSLQYE